MKSRSTNTDNPVPHIWDKTTELKGEMLWMKLKY